MLETREQTKNLYLRAPCEQSGRLWSVECDASAGVGQDEHGVAGHSAATRGVEAALDLFCGCVGCESG